MDEKEVERVVSPVAEDEEKKKLDEESGPSTNLAPLFQPGSFGPVFGGGDAGVSKKVGESTPAPPSSPTHSPPPMDPRTEDSISMGSTTSSSTSTDSQRTITEGPDSQQPSTSTSSITTISTSLANTPPGGSDETEVERESEEGFPSTAMKKLDEMLHRARWVVPVLPNQELEVLLAASIRLINKEAEKEYPDFDYFVEKLLTLSFQRLMDDDAVKDWKGEIQRCIFHCSERCIELCALKVAEDDHSVLEILFNILNPRNKYHEHNQYKQSDAVPRGEEETADTTVFATTFQQSQPQFSVSKVWLVDLINSFGNSGGFERVRSRFLYPDEKLNIALVNVYLKPFGSCAPYLTPEAINEYLLGAFEVGLRCVEGVGEAELRKGEGRDISVDLLHTLHAIARRLPEAATILPQLEFIRIKLLLMIVGVASFAGRMSALNQIREILSERSTYQHQVLKKEEVAERLRESNVVSLALKDNLHQPQYVDRVEKVFHLLLQLKAFGPEEMDQLWKAQAGKHDVIQKNVHELLARLAYDLSAEQLDRLFDLFLDSWKEGRGRERERLLLLIRRLAEDDKHGEMAEKVLNLLWDLARDPELPLELMEQAMEVHLHILDSNGLSTKKNQVKKRWLDRCIDEIKKGVEGEEEGQMWVVPAILQFQRIAQLFPESSNYYQSTRPQQFQKQSVINQLQQEFSLVAETSKSVAKYQERARKIKTASLDPHSWLPDGRFSHVMQIDARLKFIKFLLCEGALWLCSEQATELWDELIVKAVFPIDLEVGFRFFASLLSSEGDQDLDPEITVKFYETKVLQLDPTLLNEEGMKCFERFFVLVNEKERKLVIDMKRGLPLLNAYDLNGDDYLWKIIMNSPEAVGRRGTEFFRNIYSNVNVDMRKEEEERNLHQMVTENSLLRLHPLYDTLQLLVTTPSASTLEEEGRQRTIEDSAAKLTRVLRTLSAYVRAYDDDVVVDRIKLPLYRAPLGKSMTILVKWTSSGRGEETEEVMVHSNQTLGELRRELLQKFAPKTLRLQLLAANSEILEPSTEDRKTLHDLGFQDRTVIQVKSMGYAQTGTSSPESSGESSPDNRANRSPWNEDVSAIEVEKTLPSTLLSSSKDVFGFLFRIADLGGELGRGDLKKEAGDLLRLIPGSRVLEKHLTDACSQADYASLQALFVNASPSRVLYTLELTHAMLLPAKKTDHTEEFHLHFFRAGGLQLCLELLASSDFVSDKEAETRVIYWLLRILKFHLFTYLRLSYFQSSVKRTNTEDGPFSPANRATSVRTLDTITHSVPSCQDHLLRTLGNGLAQRIEEFHISLPPIPLNPSHVNTLMHVSWIAGVGHITNSSYTRRVGEEEVEVCVEALECMVLGMALAPESLQYLQNSSHWANFIIQILLSDSLIVRSAACESLCIVGIGMVGMWGGLVHFVVDLLFTVLFTTVEEKAAISSEYFRLLCKLLNYNRLQKLQFPMAVAYLRKELEWLFTAKEYTTQNLESHPQDALLDGHLRVTKELIGFLSGQEKISIGSSPEGANLIRVLLEEFLLPSSRVWVEQERNSSIQRSVTMSANLSLHSPPQPLTSSTLPRSVTTIYSPMRCTPVCGSSLNTMAAFEVVAALTYGCSENLALVVDILCNMFYGELATHPQEWDYAPSVALRGPTAFVGLKNGGATCYMNSVFQQLFMIEPLRQGILNADPGGLKMEDSDNEDISILSLVGSETGIGEKGVGGAEGRKEYNLGVLRCLQLIFANLLGSQLQFYHPKRFWKHFRFSGEPINLREQQDALEFYNSVVDSVDEALKEVGEEQVCSKVFGGLFADQKICKDCPHRYEREEGFTSISVDVRNHNSLTDSLQEYVKGDLLESDNAYFCEKCGKKVDAIKRLCIKKLPPVLAIQLKRFDFDWEREMAVKFNDFFQFPRSLDMQPYTAEGLAQREEEAMGVEQKSDSDIGSSLTLTSPTSTPLSTSNVSPSQETNPSTSPSNTHSDNNNTNSGGNNTLYRLRGVIVHSGQASGGHYYSYILCRTPSSSPSSSHHSASENTEGKWYKFDDGDVSECSLDDDEELRVQCFGGEYTNDSIDTYMKRMPGRRQKRWWNAYILVYERGQAVEERVERDLHQMSLSSRLRLMPGSLESVVRRKNMRFLHERNQYSPEYFAFIRRLSATNIPFIQNSWTSAQHREEADKLALHSLHLISKFLFTTGLHAKKSLRGHLLEWVETLKSLFAVSGECRVTFASEYLFQGSRFQEYLLESPAGDVRAMFQRILLSLAQYSRGDTTERISVSEELSGALPPVGVGGRSEGPGESLSDLIIRTMLHLISSRSSDVMRHVSQFFNFFYAYASQLGQEEKKQLFRLGVLQTFIKICLEEIPLFRNTMPELQKCFLTVAHMIRCCDIAHRSSPDGKTPNPHAKETIGKIPADIEQRLFESDKFVKKVVETAAGHEETRELVLFLCWENWEMSVRCMGNLKHELGFSYCADLRPMITLLLDILYLQDSLAPRRLQLFLKGEGDAEGVLVELQKERTRNERKSYILLKIVTQVLEDSASALYLFANSPDLRKHWINAVKWLHGEMERRPFLHYPYNSHWTATQSNETGASSFSLERTNSARSTLSRAITILQAHCAKDDEEEENSDELNDDMIVDDVSDAYRGSTSAVTVPEDPPPAYTPASGVIHSRSVSSGLEEGLTPLPPAPIPLPLPPSTPPTTSKIQGLQQMTQTKSSVKISQSQSAHTELNSPPPSSATVDDASPLPNPPTTLTPPKSMQTESDLTKIGGEVESDLTKIGGEVEQDVPTESTSDTTPSTVSSTVQDETPLANTVKQQRGL